MGSQVVSVGLVKALLANCLELQTAKHRVEEDLQEIHVISISLLHHLNPLNSDSVVNTIMLGLVNWEFGHLLE